jgi:DNA polymerase III epsilon subunit-like protein
MSDQDFTEVMVDIETTGTNPDRAAILQISAVKFNLHERTVCHDFFDRCLSIPPHRFWDEGTRNWWMQQKRSVIADIFQRAENPREVVQDFADWSNPPSTYRFFSKPTHFDFSFVASYFHDYGLPNPFHYRVATDMNSYLRGLYAPNEVPELDVPFKGDKHNGLHDTLHQIKVLFSHLDNVGV